jgi:hypothetical protein
VERRGRRVTDAIEEILAEAEQPAYHRVAVAKVLLRQDLVARHEELEAAWIEAAQGDKRRRDEAVAARNLEGSIAEAGVEFDERAPAIAEQIAELEEEMARYERSFKFRSIGYQPWQDLLAKHPPTKQQKAADARVDHNPETFPIAAMAASCVEPTLTVDQAQRLVALLTTSQFTHLWTKCLDANVGGLNVPKSRVPGLTRLPRSGSGGSATGGESPDQGSLAG